MSNLEKVIEDMREEALSLSESSRVRAVLLRYAFAVEQAAKAGSAPLPTGIFDVESAQERQSIKEGKVGIRRPRHQVERRSKRKWGYYPDLPGA